jgi:F0F1-type ATP synthase assembly protein I
MLDRQENVRNNAEKIFFRQLVAGVIFCLLGMLWQRNYFISMSIGALAGFSDAFFFLKAVVTGMPKSPQKARRGMRISMLYRMSAMVLMVLLVRIAESNVLPALFCYLFLHLTLMFNMTLFSKKNKELM